MTSSGKLLREQVGGNAENEKKSEGERKGPNVRCVSLRNIERVSTPTSVGGPAMNKN